MASNFEATIGTGARQNSVYGAGYVASTVQSVAFGSIGFAHRCHLTIWWLRSPFSGGSGQFTPVAAGGGYQGVYNAGSPVSVAFGFSPCSWRWPQLSGGCALRGGTSGTALSVQMRLARSTHPVRAPTHITRMASRSASDGRVLYGFCFYLVVALSASNSEQRERGPCYGRGAGRVYVRLQVWRRVRHPKVSFCIDCRVIWWLRSPYSGQSLYCRGTGAEGSAWPPSISGGWAVQSPRGVAFGFEVVL